MLRHQIMKLPSKDDTRKQLESIEQEIQKIKRDIASHQHTCEVRTHSSGHWTGLKPLLSLAWLRMGCQLCSCTELVRLGCTVLQVVTKKVAAVKYLIDDLLATFPQLDGHGADGSADGPQPMQLDS